MPAAAWDEYNPASRKLTIAAIQLGGKVYTNAVITVGKVVSGGGAGFTGYAYVTNSGNGVNGLVA